MAFVEREASSSKTKQKSKEGHTRVKSNQAKRFRAEEELEDLQKRINAFNNTAETFSELPLSTKTLKGLKSSHFLSPTPIQSLSVPHSLRGRDVLGSAKTGSGKTLAFLIPVLERLYLLKWGPMDGLGAVVISPTRELAVQTFNQLRDIGKYHSFSAGLVIGGKPLKEERERLGRMNILIATPGRLLQHLDSTVGLESSGVKVMVLDEADRLLDMGFLPALRAIVSHFTGQRQTLLFSATQSSDLAALAKLSLKEPLYINCNKPGEEGVVPTNLEQFFAVIPLDRKLDALWGFVKSHLKMKGVVFVTSGKQVRFIFETFRRLHPGLPLMHLHGKQKQPTRLSIFSKFSTSKSALLISTDVAARGLDFPSVDWVIQLDCPDDVDSYIHRVGRTARYQSEGKALCLLCPSEEDGMTTRWEEKGLEVKRIRIKESKMGSLSQQLQNFAFRDPEIKYLAQRAFISYMRSVHLQKDKTIFDLSALPAEEFAASLGLAGAPQIKLLETSKVKVKGSATSLVAKEQDVSDEDIGREVVGSSGSEDASAAGDEVAEDADAQASGSDEDSGMANPKPAVRTKYDRMFQRKNQSILAPHYSAMLEKDDDGSDDDVFTLARRDHDLEEPVSVLLESSKVMEPGVTTVPVDEMSKRKLKSLTSKRGLVKSRPTGEKTLFDESGNITTFYSAGQDAETAAGRERAEYMENERERIKDATKVDREAMREMKREKKRKRKEREREIRRAGDDDGEHDEGVAMIGSPVQSDNAYTPDFIPEPEPLPKAAKRFAQKSKLDDDEALALRLLQGQDVTR